MLDVVCRFCFQKTDETCFRDVWRAHRIRQGLLSWGSSVQFPGAPLGYKAPLRARHVDGRLSDGYRHHKTGNHSLLLRRRLRSRRSGRDLHQLARSRNYPDEQVSGRHACSRFHEDLTEKNH